MKNLINQIISINQNRQYINTSTTKVFHPILKQPLEFKLKPLKSLQGVKIFAMPSKIQDKDILAMFNGVIALMREKVMQEQTEKYLTLKLKYNKLKYLYTKLKLNFKNNKNTIL